MKSSVALLITALLSDAVAGRPHEIKRDIVTEVTFTTVTVANVVVYVDEQGLPYQTSTVDLVTTVQSTVVEGTTAMPGPNSPDSPQQPTLEIADKPSVITQDISQPPGPPTLVSSPALGKPVDASMTLSSNIEAMTEAISSIAPAPPQPKEPEPDRAPAVQPSAAAQISESQDGFPLGVTYDPFKPGGCKTEQEVADEWAKMADFRIVRIYGMGCDMIPRAVRLATKHNQKLMAGIYKTNDQSSENIDMVVKVLADAVKTHANGNWNIISLVSVENEKINDRSMTASDAIDYIRQAKDALGAVGYHGPVGAVETAPAVIDNPEVCRRSDLTMVNIHAFFDENTEAENAGDFVRQEVQRVKKACGDQRVVVTESGWPHDGQSHGKAVASKEKQAAAIASIRKHFTQDLFIHNAFDCAWKDDSAATFNAERFWGFL